MEDSFCTRSCPCLAELLKILFIDCRVILKISRENGTGMRNLGPKSGYWDVDPSVLERYVGVYFLLNRQIVRRKVKQVKLTNFNDGPYHFELLPGTVLLTT